jgi:integrase
VGRKRTKNLHCPPGVREVRGRWYYQPTSARERAARKAAGLPATIPLGPAGDAARKKWAELAGYRARPENTEGLVSELIDDFERRELTVNRAPGTISYYRRILRILRERFGACRYAKTEVDAIRGRGLGTVDIQRYLDEATARCGANRQVAVLSAVFSHAKRSGFTTFNPCSGVRRNREKARERDIQRWELECLIATAEATNKLLALFIRFEAICGWRPSDARLLKYSALTPQGIRLKQAKRGRRQLWVWTPALREIIEEARSLPNARVVPIKSDERYVFAGRRGRPILLNRLGRMWRDNIALANKLLEECGHGVRIAPAQLRDLRPMAAKMAAERGENRADYLGDAPATAYRHYTREEKKVTPNEW